MDLFVEFFAVWVLGYMIFHLNPLNNPNNHESKMSYYHPENIEGMEKLKEMIEKKYKEDGETDSELIIHWPDVWPYICPTLTALIYLIARYLLDYSGRVNL